MRVILLTGDRGTGKTSLAVATAIACALRGLRVALVGGDPAGGAARALGRDVGATRVTVFPGVAARELASHDPSPMLGALRRTALSEEADVCVVDSPSIATTVGFLRTIAEERTSIRWVTRPTRSATHRTRRALAQLQLFGGHVDAVIANRVLPASACDGYFASWAEHQRRELDALRALGATPLLTATLRHRELRGQPALRELAREVYGELDAEGVLAAGNPARFVQRDGGFRFELAVSEVPEDDISIFLEDRDLLVRVCDIERRIALPGALAGASVSDVRVETGVLSVGFHAPRA